MAKTMAATRITYEKCMDLYVCQLFRITTCFYLSRVSASFSFSFPSRSVPDPVLKCFPLLCDPSLLPLSLSLAFVFSSPSCLSCLSLFCSHVTSSTPASVVQHGQCRTVFATKNQQFWRFTNLLDFSVPDLPTQKWRARHQEAADLR